MTTNMIPNGAFPLPGESAERPYDRLARLCRRPQPILIAMAMAGLGLLLASPPADSAPFGGASPTAPAAPAVHTSPPPEEACPASAERAPELELEEPEAPAELGEMPRLALELDPAPLQPGDGECTEVARF